MKQKLSIILLFVFLLSLLAGCQSKAETSKGPEGSLEEILQQLYEEKQPEFPVMTTTVDLTDSNTLKYYTGLDSADQISEAIASEASISAQAYSLVLVRVKDAADAEQVAQAMFDGIDQRKWVCVEADDLRVAAAGDVVMLVMVSSELADTITAQQMTDALKTLSGGSLSTELS